MAEKYAVAKTFGKVVRKVLPISFEGPWLPKPSFERLVLDEAKKLNLKPVKRVTVDFDPFETTSRNVRKFLHYTSGAEIRETNLKCAFKVNVVNDRSDPVVRLDLENGEKYLLRARHLNALELLTLVNEVVLPLVPPPTEAAKIVETKSSKKKRK